LGGTGLGGLLLDEMVFSVKRGDDDDGLCYIVGVLRG